MAVCEWYPEVQGYFFAVNIHEDGFRGHQNATDNAGLLLQEPLVQAHPGNFSIPRLLGEGLDAVLDGLSGKRTAIRPDFNAQIVPDRQCADGDVRLLTTLPAKETDCLADSEVGEDAVPSQALEKLLQLRQQFLATGRCFCNPGANANAFLKFRLHDESPECEKRDHSAANIRQRNCSCIPAVEASRHIGKRQELARGNHLLSRRELR